MESPQLENPKQTTAEAEWTKEILDTVYELLKQDGKVKTLEDGQEVETARYSIRIPGAIGSSGYYPFIADWKVSVPGEVELNLQRPKTDSQVSITIVKRSHTIESRFSLICKEAQQPLFKVERFINGEPKGAPSLRVANNNDIHDFHRIITKNSIYLIDR